MIKQSTRTASFAPHHSEPPLFRIVIRGSRTPRLLTLLLLGSLLPASGLESSEPLELEPVRILIPGLKASASDAVRYMAQPARNGMIDLTATNGFFDRCFRAADPKPGYPGDEGLINLRFGHLASASSEVQGNARWHLWFAQPGTIEVRLYWKVPSEESGKRWLVGLDKDKRPVIVHTSDARDPQSRILRFSVSRRGKHTLTVRQPHESAADRTEIHRIRLSGSAVKSARLLRTRWRPIAVHARFTAPADCPAPDMWVFETRSVSSASSYSPLTTPFGYFGTSFEEGRVPAGAGFNFSMWISGRDAQQAPPVSDLPQLIASALPDAQFSSFGHEGTGLKFRNAVAYPVGSDRTIQALRIEAEAGQTTYYGYFYDSDDRRWRLYAAAIQPARGANAKSGQFNQKMPREIATTGSFCEIPGPPDRERSGDVVRQIIRRGWFRGSDTQWYRAELLESPIGRRRATQTLARIERGERVILNGRQVNYTGDYASTGWMTMATGGIESFLPSEAEVDFAKRPDSVSHEDLLPDYLAADKIKQLYELPVTFGATRAVSTSTDGVRIACEILGTGPDSRARLYFGLHDALTYTHKPDQPGSEVQKELFSKERTWDSSTPEQVVRSGWNYFSLSGLRPATKYYYRMFVRHEQGKSWQFKSGSFSTR